MHCVNPSPTLHVEPAAALPHGAEAIGSMVRFSLPAPQARAVDLLVFQPGDYEPYLVLPFPEHCRIGGAWAMAVRGPLPEAFEYGYRVYGPRERQGEPPILSDPYARAFGERGTWGKPIDVADPYRYRAKLGTREFDWGTDRPPRIPMADLVIYELHVRGFTQDASSAVTFPGTYAGLADKIPYLLDLGVNCVELLPVFEFDESDNPHSDPEAGQPLLNYWGYNPVGFFAPKASYAADKENPAAELKTLVKRLHAAGIEVVLDVVFNHTAEGGAGGPVISLRGLDERAFYLLDDNGQPRNLTAAGNTVACNSPAARTFILDCLRFWVTEFHVDGFRFDEASILARGADGEPLPDPPLLAEIAADPLLRDVKLIAEAWDPDGVDLVGRFSGHPRWTEWNPRYRDSIRRFLRGDPRSAGELATRLVGSPDLYGDLGPFKSVNYVTSHDGFTLRDLVSYDGKHNEANGEHNRDGGNDELSWNCGAEGPVTDPEILALRDRQVRNALLLLLVSNGTPMLTAGDELGRSQGGNSNAYCHDSELTWLDWGPANGSAELAVFTKGAIALRRAHPVFRRGVHPDGVSRGGLPPQVSWHGVRPGQPDWDSPQPLLATMWCEKAQDDGIDLVYLVANATADAVEVTPPDPPSGYCWALAADTALDSPEAIRPAGQEIALGAAPALKVTERSVVLLVAKKDSQFANRDEREMT